MANISVGVTEEIRSTLLNLKVHPRETHNDVIERLIEHYNKTKVN